MLKGGGGQLPKGEPHPLAICGDSRRACTARCIRPRKPQRVTPPSCRHGNKNARHKPGVFKL